MTYTIYWRWKSSNKISQERLEEIQRLVELAYRKALSQIVTVDGIQLIDIWKRKGLLAYLHEDACFHEEFHGSMMGRSELSFCKTDRKAYDPAVKIALIEAQKLSDNAWYIACDDGATYSKNSVLAKGKWETWLPIERVKIRR